MPSIARTLAADMRRIREAGEAYELLLPGDPELKASLTATARRRAELLSGYGWKFEHKEGPRGHYYEGHGPAGARVMSEQKSDQQQAFIAAINHAFDVQFP